MSLLQRVRDTGRYPPSLLSDERNVGDVGFDALISRILDPTVPNSISLGFDSQVADDFQKVLNVSKLFLYGTYKLVHGRARISSTPMFCSFAQSFFF